MSRKIFRTLLWIISIAISLGACGPSYSYEVPAQTDDGWHVASLDEVGLEERPLRKMIDRIDDSTNAGLHSVLIVKDGKLVFEEYFSGYTYDYFGDQFQGEYVDFDANTVHNQASVTKVYTSALVGISIDQGYLPDVNTPACDYFPQYDNLCDKTKEGITVEHLLTMTSGLKWNQREKSMTDTSNDLIQLWIVDDPIAYIFEKPVVAAPGSRWYYSEADPNLLGEIVQEATGLMLDEFAAHHLFAPLNITQHEWNYVNEDMVWASGDLKIRPRDMAKLGYLYLNGGVWDGQQILSKEWIDMSIQAYISVPDAYMSERWGDRYGYQWWLRTYNIKSTLVDSFLRTGWGGQAIIVFPSVDMVVVFTGGNYAVEDYMTPMHEIVASYILPAVEQFRK